MPTPTNTRHAAIGYICAVPDEASAMLFTAWCRRRAAADGWQLTEMVSDSDELQPLAERPGWQRVTELITASAIGAVVTVNRSMIAFAAPDWARVSDLLAGLGAGLVTTGSTARSTSAPAATDVR